MTNSPQNCSAGSADLIKMLDLHVDGVRHYLHLQIGKPMSKDLISAPEIALDNLHREVKAAIQSTGVAQPAALRAAAERVCWFDWSGNDMDAIAAIEELRKALASQLSPAATVETGCICQDQHRRGHCTELGCQNSLTRLSAGNEQVAREASDLADKIEYALRTEGKVTLHQTDGTRALYAVRKLFADEPQEARKP